MKLTIKIKPSAAKKLLHSIEKGKSITLLAKDINRLLGDGKSKTK